MSAEYTVFIQDGPNGGGYSRTVRGIRAAVRFARAECAARYVDRTTAVIVRSTEVWGDSGEVRRYANVAGRAVRS